ncbi:MAG TPA: Eco57I restriction-modification methylase domain-containing protein [Rectinema sp.]|nr:Eco57I restriction-modification methylase domain-containing protein [Rectinema sp.]
MSSTAIKLTAHIVDVLGNVIGRDQPILRMEKALEMVSLLGADTFLDDNVIFFDPFCKAGELLLACAFHSCWAKAKSKHHLLDAEMVFKEIYQSNRYFGLSPDERHHRLSRRTFLGNTHSHNEEFNHIIRDGHYLSEIDGRLDEEKFEEEFNSMIEYINARAKNKRLIAIGNPPYQEADGGHGGSSTPIYTRFVEKIIASNKFEAMHLVIPARWFSVGDASLRAFRQKILASSNIRSLTYFERSEDIFPTVHVQGGICFLLWDKTHSGSAAFGYKDQSILADLNQFDIIPDDPFATPIISKIIKTWKGHFHADHAWTGKPFGLRTFYFQRNESATSDTKDAIKCYTKGRKIKYIKRSLVEKNADKIDEWKIAVPKAYATGARRCTLPPHQIFLIERGAICTETYNVLCSFKTKADAERVIGYLRTDFCRYLLGLRKLTQDIPKDRWAWVPYMGTEKEYSEDDLFRIFKITKEEQAHIKRKVQEWS